MLIEEALGDAGTRLRDAADEMPLPDFACPAPRSTRRIVLATAAVGIGSTAAVLLAVVSRDGSTTVRTEVGFRPPGREVRLVATDEGPQVPIGPLIAAYRVVGGSEPFTSLITGAPDDGPLQGGVVRCIQVNGGAGCGPIDGEPDPSFLRVVGTPEYAAWGDLPPETTFVVFETGGRTWYERPRDSVVVFAYPADGPATFTLTAFDADGEVLARFEGEGAERCADARSGC